MVLSDRQIERYSRQIIAIGGIAQERLIAARITLAGEVADVEPVFDYLVGAGVGRINLRLVGEVQDRERLIARAREVNPDAVEAGTPSNRPSAALLLVLAGSGPALALGAELCAEAVGSPTVFARLDRPAKVVTIRNPPPYPAGVAAKLFAPYWYRSAAAGIVAMVAAVEALKLLIAD
ncbi:MAG: hypothetical protein ACREQD_14790, partial [Candidatus Binataceae bacterium]